MNTVEPIRDLNQIEAMKKILKTSSIRDYLLFVMGINVGLRISDLLVLKQGDIMDDGGRDTGLHPDPGEKNTQTEGFQAEQIGQKRR